MSLYHRLYFVYIGIARFVATYIYSSLLTLVSLQLTRNLRYNYFRAALSQEIAFFDKGTAGSISMQATSHGEVIQAGLSEKFGQIFQCIATFLTAFIIAFVSQWKLTLICICIVPTIIVIMVITGGMDTVIELKILGNFAQAASFAESTIGSVRTTHAFSLGPKMSQKYSQYMAEAKTLGAKKSPIHGLMNGSVWFIMFSGMGLAFWQGISMIARGEVENIGTVFT
jgi:ATP-binding cassette subfamily B (MDR/TAP) protein 1